MVDYPDGMVPGMMRERDSLRRELAEARAEVERRKEQKERLADFWAQERARAGRAESQLASRDKELLALRTILERCQTVLGNMALENEGHASIFRRWPISHEPLRSDAKNLLPEIAAALNAEQREGA